MPNYHNDSVQRLYSVIADINTPEECRAFFEDLCTIKEIQDMAQRLDTALLLDIRKYRRRLRSAQQPSAV